MRRFRPYALIAVVVAVVVLTALLVTVSGFD